MPPLQAGGAVRPRLFRRTAWPFPLLAAFIAISHLFGQPVVQVVFGSFSGCGYVHRRKT
ncbi:MAG: hypothetical protein JW764_08360 [Chlorobiaceae bacterium]|nr:hypothetical protein [Chlorobiaceae bacterium]